MRKNLKKIVTHGFILSVVSAIVTLLSLFITNKGFYILSYKPLAVILSFILVLGFSLLVYILSNIIISVFITFNLFSSLSVASLIKYEMRNIPAIFNDFFLFDEFNKLGGYVHFSEYIPQIASIIALNLIFIACFIVRWKKFDWRSNRFVRLLGAGLSFFLLASSLYAIKTTQMPFEKSGPIYVFSASIWNKSEYALTVFEEEDLGKIIEEKDPSEKENTTSSNQANIIIIMNEAFWDLYQLPGVTMSPNPYEKFDQIKQESLYGRFEVPVFAGGTCNTEFEVLSSISTHMYEEGLMVFNNEIQGPIITLASILRNQGYKSVGLHPFCGWYYNRNLLYSYLGFDKFITAEHISDSKLKGYYISDDTTTDVIIDQIEATEKPLFLYAVTMQNHGPYDDGRFDNQSLDISITGENLDETALTLLEVYGQGVFDAVNSLQKLLDYLKESDEETIVVFFGDHLPLLGPDFKVYRDTGFLDESDNYIHKYLQMRTTPFVIWSNSSNESQDLGVMDTIFIGPYLLNRCQLLMPDYYKNLLDIYAHTDFISPVFLENDGGYHHRDSKIYHAISDPMVTIQKDIMYGDRLYESNASQWLIENNYDYNQDLRNIQIEKVYEKDDHLVVSGTNLYSKGLVFIDGDAVDFSYHSGSLWIETAALPDTGSFSIRMELFDTIEKSMAKSNTY